MPQALKLLEKYKAEVGATDQNADSDGESGVAFSQADAWQSITTAVACGVRLPGISLSKSYSRLTSRFCILLSSANLSLILLKKFEGLRHSRWLYIIIHKVLVIQGALNPLGPAPISH